ncbi:electron transfer flavoprotein, beta subunit [Treponema primitia ZAS-2]|uniref:Protein FixA n=1 Tax=Treponema primitia (strain ATCC BAA-887 / DSM 12427 / ZAS-2) TaxID=545694 RepID=F5YRG5_TREPZ|nr:electron transfer flavoprotein subunit beta/FixA family protein [Treponema primitia]AEF83641.1 electron transfer flavoprotein, beta subunit [Treponema primitia ZAS-2]
MGLNIIVLVKQVPDTQNITGQAMKEDGTVNRAALPAIFNPEDLYGLEAALLLKDQFPGTKVNVISMGPPAAAAVLKECLYRGADFAALVSDRGFAGADTLATSYALKCAIQKVGNYDLVLCGRQAIDGDTAQVGPQTAEKLGINQITCVSKVEKVDPGKKEIIALRSIEGGWEKVKAKLPVLVTFTDEGEAPRPSSAKRLMTHKNAAPAPDGSALALWDIPAIKADPNQCGLAGSPTKVKNINSVVLTAGEIKYIDPSELGITELVHGLIADHTLG